LERDRKGQRAIVCNFLGRKSGNEAVQMLVENGVHQSFSAHTLERISLVLDFFFGLTSCQAKK